MRDSYLGFSQNRQKAWRGAVNAVTENVQDQRDGPVTRALVVDDHKFIRFTLKNTLSKLGVTHVDEAEDGDAALARLNASAAPFDIIFCDLQMPGRDGIETLRAFAGLGVKSGIVLMSGEDLSILAAAENLARSHGLKVLGHVTKPVSAEVVKHFLSAMDSSRPQVGKATPTERVDDIDIRRGLENNDFYVVYQPKVSLKNGQLHGVEALARWKHPRFGLISPVVFVPIAEQSGMIDQLMEFVLGQALTGKGLWRSLNHDINVAINVSTQSMVHLDLPDRLAAIVNRAGANPSSFVLEVTESRLADNMSAFLEIATRLRLKGFRLSIDDFGTGFSTLEQLSRLPVSELKIDRAFVAGAPENDRTRAILEASLTLARNLNLTTVCEGAETAAEYDLVGNLGADCVQGFYVAKPMMADQILPWENQRH